MAIRDSTILFVGSDYKPYLGAKTEVIDLDGKMMVPGFTDNHTHFLSGGMQLASVNLRDAKSKNEFIGILKNYCGALQDKRWVQGGDWDHEAWGGQLPSKEWIDSVTGDHPLFITRYDGHMSLANSLALRLAHIDSHTPNPPGGEIVKDPVTGEPTGILRDEATDLVSKVIPMHSSKELEESLQRAEDEAFQHGITQVHDMGSYGGWVDLNTYRDAYAKNKLQLRIYSFVPIRSWRRL